MRSALVFLLVLASVALSTQDSHLRFGHYANSITTPTGEDVNVWLNGKLTFQSEFSSISSYVPIANGIINVTVTDSKNVTLVSNNVNVVDNYYTVAVYGNGSFVTFTDSFYQPNIAAGNAVLRVINLESATNLPISVLVGTSYTFNGLNLGSASSYIDILQGLSYNVSVVINSTQDSFGQQNFTVGVAYTCVAFGPMRTDFRCFVDMDYRQTSVRVFHTSPDAPSATVKIGAVTLTVTFGTQSAYTQVPYGNQIITAVLGSTTLLYSTTFTPLDSFSIFLYGFYQPPVGNSNKLTLASVLDRPANQTYGAPLVRFGNFVPDRNNLIISSLWGNQTIYYGTSGLSTLAVPAGTFQINVYNGSMFRSKRALQDGSSVATQTVSFSNGVVYSVLVEGSGSNVVIIADNQPSPGSDGLSGGAIAGIVIGCIVGVILLFGIAFYFYRRSAYQSI